MSSPKRAGTGEVPVAPPEKIAPARNRKEGRALVSYQREPEAVRAPQSPSALFHPAGAFSSKSSLGWRLPRETPDCEISTGSTVVAILVAMRARIVVGVAAVVMPTVESARNRIASKTADCRSGDDAA